MPPSHHGLVARPRLWQQLNGNLGDGVVFRRKMTLVSAPPGFGKTTLIAEWLRQNEFVPAWFSLDEADNDSSRFQIYFIAALQTILPDFGQEILSLLTTSQGVPSENIMPLLVNELTAVTKPIIFVFDDFHLINQPDIQQSVEFLLANQPPNFHMVMITRADPPFNLARLRGQRQITELRVKDLRFTHEEIIQFLQQEDGRQLSASDVNVLAKRTEGWVAGLQLAVLSWQGLDDVSAAIAQFGGADRYIVDYLLEEVLQRQPEAIQDFLLQTAVLDRLSGALCDAVLEHKSGTSQQILEQLERENLFTVPLDNQRTWFRYHHLFAELLTQRLKQIAPNKVPNLHLRASNWFAQEGFVEEAITHALAAHAYEQTADLLEANQRVLLWEQRRLNNLWQWLDMLPDELIKLRPRLGLIRCWLMMMMFDDWVQIERWVQIVQGAMRTAVIPDVAQVEMQIELKLLESGLSRKQGDVEMAIHHAQEALDIMSPDELHWRSGSLATLATFYEMQGNITLAIDTYRDGLKASKAAQHNYIYCISLARIIEMQIVQGDLRQAYALFTEFTQKEFRHVGPDLGMLYISFGSLLREMNRLPEAVDYLRQGIKLCQPFPAWDVIQIIGLIGLAWVHQAEGDFTAAQKTIQKACALDPGPYYYSAARAEAQRARLNLAQGNLAEAVRWAETSGLSYTDEPDYAHEIDYLTLTRILIACGEPDDALQLLKTLQETAVSAARNGRLIEILILQAITYDQMGKRPLALTHLQQALDLAEPEGYQRLFLDEGEPIVKLLQVAVQQDIYSEYVTQMDTAVSPKTKPQQTEVPPPSANKYPLQPLTQREQETLRLLATNLTIPEIADQLFVSVSTVRTYTKHIYSKLDVHSRIEAIHRAEAYGLL